MYEYAHLGPTPGWYMYVLHVTIPYVSCMSHSWLQHYWPLYLVFLSLESLIPVLCIVLFFPLYPTVSLCTTHCTPHSCPLHFLHCIPLYSTVFLLYVPNSCPLYHALLSSVFHINVGHSLSVSHILSVYIPHSYSVLYFPHSYSFLNPTFFYTLYRLTELLIFYIPPLSHIICHILSCSSVVISTATAVTSSNLYVYVQYVWWTYHRNYRLIFCFIAPVTGSVWNNYIWPVVRRR